MKNYQHMRCFLVDWSSVYTYIKKETHFDLTLSFFFFLLQCILFFLFILFVNNKFTTLVQSLTITILDNISTDNITKTTSIWKYSSHKMFAAGARKWLPLPCRRICSIHQIDRSNAFWGWSSIKLRSRMTLLRQLKWKRYMVVKE